MTDALWTLLAVLTQDACNGPAAEAGMHPASTTMIAGSTAFQSRDVPMVVTILSALSPMKGSKCGVKGQLSPGNEGGGERLQQALRVNQDCWMLPLRQHRGGMRSRIGEWTPPSNTCPSFTLTDKCEEALSPSSNKVRISEIQTQCLMMSI